MGELVINGRVKAGGFRHRALAWLQDNPGSSATDVTRALGLSLRSARTSALDAMVYAGLVTVTAEKRDTRPAPVRVYSVAPPGHVPPPRPEPSPALRAARAAQRAASRAKTRPAAPDPEPLPSGAAACAGEDPEMFFPGFLAAPDVRKAKAVCARCPARAGCLAGALARAEPHGIWGGEVFENGRVIPGRRLAAAAVSQDRAWKH
jgi:WhiB family redox-sensing transcriptional regulator